MGGGGEEPGARVVGDESDVGLVEVVADLVDGGMRSALGHMKANVLGHHLRVHDMLHCGLEVEPLNSKANKLIECLHPCVNGGLS